MYKGIVHLFHKLTASILEVGEEKFIIQQAHCVKSTLKFNGSSKICLKLIQGKIYTMITSFAK